MKVTLDAFGEGYHLKGPGRNVTYFEIRDRLPGEPGIFRNGCFHQRVVYSKSSEKPEEQLLGVARRFGRMSVQFGGEFVDRTNGEANA